MRLLQLLRQVVSLALWAFTAVQRGVLRGERGRPTASKHTFSELPGHSGGCNEYREEEIKVQGTAMRVQGKESHPTINMRMAPKIKENHTRHTDSTRKRREVKTKTTTTIAFEIRMEAQLKDKKRV